MWIKGEEKLKTDNNVGRFAEEYFGILALEGRRMVNV